MMTVQAELSSLVELVKLQDRIKDAANHDGEGLALVWTDTQGRIYTRSISDARSLTKLEDDDWLVVCNKTVQLDDLRGVFEEEGLKFTDVGRLRVSRT